jgi:hypothetical protein
MAEEFDPRDRGDPPEIWVLQDGPDFYIYERERCEMNDYVRHCTAPFKVSDFDLAAAKRAREWFNENGYFKGVTKVNWPNPFK